MKFCAHLRSFLNFLALFFALHLITIVLNQPQLVYSQSSNFLDSSHIEWSSFEKIFPEKLREQFSKCISIQDDGERAVCELLVATDTEAASSGDREISPESHVELASITDSCPYRTEGGPDLHRHASQGAPQLQALLDSYAKMHRSCAIVEYSNLADIHQRHLTPACRYIIWSSTELDLGNIIMSLISTFLYALLSQRVLLVDNSEWGNLFCEPFLGSRFAAPAGFSLKNDQTPIFSQFYDLGCGSGSRSHLPECKSEVISVSFSHATKAADHRFLVCPSALASVRNVPFLNFRDSNQYFATGLFLNPALRPVLGKLFPELNVFHPLARFLLNPAQPVWERIHLFHAAHLSNSAKLMGVQLREFKGQYQDYYDMAAPRCIKRKSGICPIELAEAKLRLKSDPNLAIPISEDYISVYLSSPADSSHLTKLNKSLDEIEQETGQQYRIFSQLSDKQQLDNLNELQKALLDIWLLSLSDILMTSHMSTVGYTAQGLAGITPYHLKPWPNDPCWLSISSDPCYHVAPKRVSCRKDKFGMRRASRAVGYVHACPDLPNTGLQLAEYSD